MIWWMIAQALAASPADYPLQATVEAPPEGVALIPLPLEAIGTYGDALSQRVLLQNAAGQVVPFALLGPSPHAEEERVLLTPESNSAVVVQQTSRVVDALTLPLSEDGVWLVQVLHKEGEQWVAEGPPQRVYQSGGVTESRVTVEPGRGPWMLRFDPTAPSSVSARSGSAWVASAAPRAQVQTLSLDAPTPMATEEGRTRYVVDLGKTVRVLGVEVSVKDDLFSRAINVYRPGQDTARELLVSGSLQGLQIGGSSVHRTRVADFSAATDTLILEIEDDHGRRLDIDGVRVWVDASALVVRNPGPGPLSLWLGAPDGDGTYDLAIGTAELMRMQPRVATVSAPVSNPAYVPRPTQAGIDGPGEVLPTHDFKERRAITGPPGWARVALDAHVVAVAPNLGELRVLDSQGRQIPYLLQQRYREEPVALGEVTTEQVGRLTRLRIPVPVEGPLGTLTLETTGEVFDRSVRVLRDRGKITETVRAVRWESGATGQVLGLSLGEAFGKEILVEIDNGDNPPIPVSTVRLTAAANPELRFRIPDDGQAFLYYGAHKLRAPDYDVYALQSQIVQMQLPTAALGPVETVAAPALSGLDRVLVLGTLAALTVGLIGLAVRLVGALRAVAEPREPV